MGGPKALAAAASSPSNPSILRAVAHLSKLLARIPLSKFSKQVLCASCSEQVALSKLSARFPLSKFSNQVLSASCSQQVSSIRETLSYLNVAISQPELRTFTSRATLVLKSCDIPAGAAKVYFAYYFRT